MEIKTIEILLEKYLEGETSLKEETVLRAYFNEEQNLPIEWTHYRQFFNYYELAKNESFPTAKIKSKTRIRTWMMAAASITLVIGLSLNTFFESQSAPLEQQEAEFAFQQFQKQMKNVSNHFNKGVQKVAYLDYWNESTQKLIK
ncbi:DUF3379 domain-containing protein [Flavobacteriaceae bacterium]|nr:DUF3379 domain-containing protein [Flavobacteriaceae bacterium]MDB3862618.1 DUF3379 domain-containing protein [Flavobacteriaceae bacterium]